MMGTFKVKRRDHCGALGRKRLMMAHHTGLPATYRSVCVCVWGGGINRTVIAFCHCGSEVHSEGSLLRGGTEDKPARQGG